jgi:D-beta-D-heptose 7-phosphate kinase/D-beta-D-heptose 1-phosphate adenosyltransferase
VTEKKIVFTNGCFDIIHVGHIKLLEFCASLGQVIVGLNSDESVKRLKGVSRPINNQVDRKEVLSAIKFVGEVVIFDEDTPYSLIKKIRPDIIVKGGDYLAENVIGSDISEIRIFPFLSGKSTTNLISNLRDIDRLSEEDLER